MAESPTLKPEAPVDFEKALAKLKAYYDNQMKYSGQANHNPYIALERHQYASLLAKAENKTLNAAGYAQVLALDDKFVPSLTNLGF